MFLGTLIFSPPKILGGLLFLSGVIVVFLCVCFSVRPGQVTPLIFQANVRGFGGRMDKVFDW